MRPDPFCSMKSCRVCSHIAYSQRRSQNGTALPCSCGVQFTPPLDFFETGDEGPRFQSGDWCTFPNVDLGIQEHHALLGFS
jgi:hypothetical protein